MTLADPPAARGALVTFLVDGAEPRDVALALAERAVQLVSVPAGHGRWDLAGRDLAAVVRAAPHVYTSDGDLDALLEGVADIARPARARSNGRRAVPPGPPVERTDVVVVGLGAHGSAAARSLAERGLNVIGLERLRLGHDRGSSHGATRMIRRAYPSAAWDDLVDRAYGAWGRLEEASGEQLLLPTGGVFARPRDAADALRGPGCEVLDAAAVARGVPGDPARRGPRGPPRPGGGRPARRPRPRGAARARPPIGRAPAGGGAAPRLGAGRGGRRRGDDHRSDRRGAARRVRRRLDPGTAARAGPGAARRADRQRPPRAARCRGGRRAGVGRLRLRSAARARLRRRRARAATA